VCEAKKAGTAQESQTNHHHSERKDVSTQGDVVAQHQGSEAVSGGEEVRKVGGKSAHVEESASAPEGTLHKLKNKLFKH
jgi:hypothetical protein